MGEFKLGSDLPFTPQQLLVQLESEDGQTGESALVLLKSGKFQTVFDVTREPWKNLPAGKFNVNIAIGDKSLEESVIWKVAAAQLTPHTPKPKARKASKYEPVNDDIPRFEPKGDLHHTFAVPEQ